MSILDSKGLYKAYLKLIIYEILRKIMCFFLIDYVVEMILFISGLKLR